MLDTKCERRNRERFILEKKIPVAIVSSNPLEHLADINLLGDFSSVKNAKIEFSEPRLFLNQQIIENSFENASRDLLKNAENPFLINNLGKALMNKGLFDKAIALFEQVTAKKPDFSPALFNLAACYEAKNDLEKADKIYQKILSVDSNDARALINIGNLYIRKGELEKAKDLFEKIIKIDSKNVSAIDRLAFLCLQKGDFNRATSLLKQCLQLSSNLPAVYNNLGVAYVASKQFEKGRENLQIALNLYPKYNIAVVNLVNLLNRLKKYDEAIDLLQAYLRENENLDMRELLARTYLSVNKYEVSLSHLTKILEAMKKRDSSMQDRSRILNNIGVAYHKMGNLKEAENYYQQCVQKVGYANHIIVSNLIDVYFDSNKPEEAKKYVDILQDRFKDKKTYYYFTAKYYYFKDEIEKAIQYFHFSLKENKRFLPAYSFLSCIYSEQCRDYSNAIKVNEDGIKLFPEDAIIVNNLAYNYLMNNQIEEARKVLRVIAEEKYNLFLYATKGLLRIKEGDIEEGRRLYNLAAKMTNNDNLKRKVNQKKNLELGRYYLFQNRKDSAKECFSKVVKLGYKEGFYVSEAEELLKNLNEL